MISQQAKYTEPNYNRQYTNADPDIVSIRSDLKGLTKDLLSLGNQFSTAKRELPAKQMRAKVAYAVAYGKLDPNLKVDERKSLALLETSEIQLESDIAEAEVEALKQAIKITSDALNSTQSMSRLLTTELRMSTYET